MTKQSRCSVHKKIFPLVALFFLPVIALAEPVSLKRAVELALKHATAGDIALADEQHAVAAYRELRNDYVPQLMGGAGIGPSYGFPLSLVGSAPSLFNLTAQSALLNPSLRAYMKAAKIDVEATSLRTKDQRNQTIQDTVLSYAELAKWEQRLAGLKESQAFAEKLETAEAERVKEGIDSEVEGDRAKLSTARVHMRVTEAEGAAVVLREHLSKLTGLPAAGFQTDPDSLPSFPAPPAHDVSSDTVTPDQAGAANPAVNSALEHARAQYLRAEGEHKALWPSLDFGAQYAFLSTDLNNYQRFYQPGSFQANNVTFGASIRIPILNYSQRARASEADADALKAKKQAEAAKNQASEETLRLQRSVAQLQAAHDVAALEYEIAQKDLEATQTRYDAGTAALHDMDDARMAASEKFITLQDVAFELERSQVGLLRATGDLEKWALGTP
jgi:outer membrane protein TolC